MKMPERPWYPLISDRPDIFGLQHITLAGAACETDTNRKQRIAKVEAGVTAAFRAAIHHLGEDEARELFNRVMRRPKRGRGKVCERRSKSALFCRHVGGHRRLTAAADFPECQGPAP
jgi:hypothetical protein